MTQKLSLAEIQKIKTDICANWINQLDIAIQSFDDTSAVFHWATSDELLRIVNTGEKIMSGQATMAVADTASFMTICAINQQMRNCVTIDLHSNFMRPLTDGVIEVSINAIAKGRKTVTTRSDFRMLGSSKLCATATGVFMYLD